MKNVNLKTLALFSVALIIGLLAGFSDCALLHASSNDGMSIAAGIVGIGAMRDRAIFNSLKKQYGGAVASPSYLRIEQVLSNSSGKYEFRFKRTNTEKIHEVKLEQNDIFVVTDLAVYLLKADTTKEGKDVLQTFVNQQVFVAATGFTPGHLEAIYNGKLSLKVGRIKHVESLSMQEFRFIPETQQSSGTNLSQYSVKDAKYPLGTLFHLRGDQDITITVEFPTFSGMQIAAVASNTEHRLVFHPYGYLLRGAAK